MKNVLLIAIMLGLVSTVAAQTSNTGTSTRECKLKLSQAPAIRGVHLGMTVNELLEVFPGADKDESLRKRSQARFGVIHANLEPAKYGSKEKFVGVGGVGFSFLDGELIYFHLSYDGPEFETSGQFVSKVVETLNLPGVEFWQDHGTNAKMTCDGFEISVQVNKGTNWINVRNLGKDANKVAHEREEAVKAEARRAFKP